jgi:hypothetical protein
LKSEKRSSTAHGRDQQEPFARNDFVHSKSANAR